MEEVGKEDRGFVVGSVVALLFGKIDSIKSCVSGSGLNVGSLRATA
jgi:hypothetical protein